MDVDWGQVSIVSPTRRFLCEGGRFWFEANAAGLVIVPCRHCARKLSKELGYKVVVLHYFDVILGRQVATRVFQDASNLTNPTERR